MDKKNDLIFSIITVCYNSEEFIKDCMISVLNQSYKSIEHIIVDGSSSDNTMNIVKDMSNLDENIKWVSEKDDGLYDGMNKGIKMAKGDIIAFLNSDDIYGTNKAIEEIKNVFVLNPEYDAVYCNMEYVDRNDINQIKREYIMPKNKFSKFKYGWVPGHPTFFAKKDLYEKYGYYDLDFPVAADFDLLCRFIEKNKIKIKYYPKKLIKMREGGISNNKGIKSVVKNTFECYKSLKKNKVFPYFIFLKPLRKLYYQLRTKIKM